jgi:DNA-binding XRE family transcriptional regulator
LSLKNCRDIKTEIQILINGVPAAPTHDQTNSFLTADGSVRKTPTAQKAHSDTLAQAIGAELQAARLNAGFTKAETGRIAGVAQLTVAKVEKQGGTLSIMTKIAEAVDRKLVFTLTDVKGSMVELPASHATDVLDQLRERMGIDFSTMARRVGTSYRTMRVFNDASRNSIFSVERYAKALGFTLGFRME